MTSDHQESAWPKVAVTLATFGALILLSLIGLRLFDRGPLITAYDEAWRDSFGTNVTEDVAAALPLDKSAREMMQFVESNGFACKRSELLQDFGFHICQRRRLRVRLLSFAYEKWVLEFECRAKLPRCNHFAMVR
ncbi:hypothetical protein [Microvirga guangxiensis]|uniref:hypothetical protein n=1 Tax=Microvirga guangxiensis TaxID=549386 RepID=UPI00158781BD|nr:hypothetical protein [Microvirga guangxiensis]